MQKANENTQILKNYLINFEECAKSNTQNFYIEIFQKIRQVFNMGADKQY